ncbi:MAG: helix-turn-helix domain-containing protein, partial [Solirubrobacteraceae bacterium]
MIQVFSRERPALTLSEVAQLAGITRASARRILLTLQLLGYMHSDGRIFSPTPRLLSLGWTYLSSLSFTETAGLLLEELADKVQEAC